MAKGNGRTGLSIPLHAGAVLPRRDCGHSIGRHVAERRDLCQLAPVDQDRALKSLEKGDLPLDGVDGKGFFSMFLQNVKEGYFADPIYGGNRNMAAWKMIGFPGAHYDYKEWVFFPPLGQNGMLQQDDATGLVHVIRGGSRTGPSPTRTSPLTMPSYAWKLSNMEIADVATYLRNSWGNHASPVTKSRSTRCVAS